MFENKYMNMALEKARAAARAGEIPVGVVIVDGNGEIIAAVRNQTEELNDPTAHAEMLAIKEATTKKGAARIPDCDMYVTLEPCPMCAQAISFARIRRLYYGAADPKGGGVESGARIFSASSCHHKPEVYSGIQAEESSTLLKDFFKDKR